MRNQNILLAVVNLAFSLVWPQFAQAAVKIKAVDLRCEYAVDPTGIDATTPRLSWRIESEASGFNQSAYRILVASSAELLAGDKGDLWDSGKVASGQSQLVPYGGKPLGSSMPCHWKVRVWSGTGEASDWSVPARWTMGLLKPEDWSCQWIGAPAPAEAEAGDMAGIKINKASYRTLDGKVAKDVTEIVRKLVAARKPFSVNFEVLGGDPARGVEKELVVEFTRNGKAGVARARDFKPFRFTGPANSGQAAYQFRKDFKLPAKPAFAQVTVHSPAYFELYINGKKAGRDVLTPAVSDLEKRSFSVSYDVSSLLSEGTNTIGLWLGIGWADEITVRAQLYAEVNGERLTIGTDESWKTRPSGYYKLGERQWNNYGGELVDGRELLPNWCDPAVDSGSWDNARGMKPLPGEVQAQACPTNVVGKELPAIAIRDLGRQSYEIDFGTALAGWLRMTMRDLGAGDTVTMTFAEKKGKGRLKRSIQIGDTHYQHYNQVSRYIAAGSGEEIFEHKFNYAGFRYVIVQGLKTPPQVGDFTAKLIESNLESAGSFECSNELFNRIHEVNHWTQRSLNLGGYYVDCPTRERWGYGDGQVAAEGFMSNFRADGFYRKWTEDWRTGQQPDGRIRHTAPWGHGGGGPAWGGALSAITWRHYLYYGDVRVLEENYESIRRYVEWLEGKCVDGLLKVYGDRMTFIGDWVPPRRGMDTKNWPNEPMRELFNNCYHIQQMDLLRKMAEILGKDEDQQHYARRLAEIRPRVHDTFYDAKNQHYVIDEQSYYIMPLLAGVAPESERAALLKNLENNILVKNKGHLDTGMLGTYFMMEYLREIGRSDLVFTMFNQTKYPGWGYMLEQGATTMWEQWNGHWSQIHSCFTSPDNWFYQGLAGISADPKAPGFKNVIIKPAVVGDVSWVKAHHDSPYGRIVSNWKREGERLTMEVTIPANSTATVFVPTSDPSTVTESGVAAGKATGVEEQEHQKKSAVYRVESGQYRFEAQL